MTELIAIQPNLNYFARKLCKSNYYYKDLVQDTNIKIIQKIGRYKQGKDFTKWACTILFNTFIDFKRKEIFFESLKTVKSNDVIKDKIGINKSLRVITNFNIREVMILRYKFDMSYQEIVDCTGNSMANVKTLLHRGRKLIIEQYGHTKKNNPRLMEKVRW